MSRPAIPRLAWRRGKSSLSRTGFWLLGDYGSTPLISIISLNNVRTAQWEKSMMITATSRKLTRL
jgi:hypothetical protein